MFVCTIVLLIVTLIAFGTLRYVNAEESEGLVSVEQKNTDSNAEKTDGDEPDSEGDLGNVDTSGNSGESQGGNTLESGSNEEGSENPGDDPKGKSGSEPGTGGGENSEDAASDDESGNSLDEALDDEDLVCICLEECTRASHNVTENENQTVDGDSEDMTVDGDNEDPSDVRVGEATKTDSDAADFVNQDCPLCMRDYTKCQFEANRLALLPTVATVKTFVLDEDEESETYQSIIEAIVEFKNLDTAFNTLPKIVEEVRGLGSEYESYYPTIVLNSNISELTTLNLSSSCDLWIDLHGFSLSFAENEGMFIGSNNITIQDSSYTGISENGELIPRGSINCNCDAMFSGTGSITVINGHFTNERGVIFAKGDGAPGNADETCDVSEAEYSFEADLETGSETEPEPTASIFDDVLRVIITDGFFATGGSYIFGAEVEYRVFNGAFSFKPATRYPVSFQEGGSFLLPDGRILKPTEVRIGENLVECFEPVEASFAAYIEKTEVDEIEEYCFYDFYIATKVAMEISIENAGAICVIRATENNM